jgi:hypothetical protein
MTLVLKTGLPQLTRWQFPKPLTTNPLRKPQNRRSSRTTLPKTSAPALPSNRQTKTAVSLPIPQPHQTAVPHPTRPSSPKPNQPTCATTDKTAAVANPLCRKRLRQLCPTAAKQNRPSPAKACATAQTLTNQPASTFRRLTNTATRHKMTQTSWLNRVGVRFPKLTPCPNAQQESGLLPPKPFAVFQNLKTLSPREPTRILETKRDQNLKKWPQ